MVPLPNGHRVALALAVVFTVGCEGKKTEDKSPAPVAKPPAKKTVAAEGLSVELLEPGAEPRHQLRFDMKKGAKAEAEFRMTLDFDVETDGRPQEKVKVPSLKAVMAVKVTSADAGEFAYDWTFRDYAPEPTEGVSGQMMAAFKGGLKQLVGTKGVGRISATGHNLGATFEMPKEATPQLAQLIESIRDGLKSMSTPLPDEPIGVGAKWRVVQPMNQNGIKSNLESTYTITKIDGAEIGLEVELSTEGISGPLTNSPLPGTKVFLDSMKGSGKASMVIRLDRPIPLSSVLEIDSTSKSTMQITGLSQKNEVRSKLKIELAAQ